MAEKVCDGLKERGEEVGSGGRLEVDERPREAQTCLEAGWGALPRTGCSLCGLPTPRRETVGGEVGVAGFMEGGASSRRAAVGAHLDFLHRVVVVHAQVHVVRPRNDPLLADHKLGAAHWHFAHLKALDKQLPCTGRVQRSKGAKGQ